VSFLDDRERQFNWLAAPVASSWLVAPGCVQCGHTLEDGDYAGDNLSGKCVNCRGFVAEDDTDFSDELEG
jgi:hypothetical protein